MSWKVLIIVDNVYKEFSFFVCLTIVTLILIATFLLRTAGLHQAIVSIYRVELFVPPWLIVIGVPQFSLLVGGFPSKALLAVRVQRTARDQFLPLKMLTMLWIETHQPWARFGIHQSLWDTQSRLCPAFFWRQFEWATFLLVHLLLLA